MEGSEKGKAKQDEKGREIKNNTKLRKYQTMPLKGE